MAAVYLLTLENPVFAMYVLCTAILLLKTLLMAPLTTRQRMKHKNFALPEDDKKRETKDDVLVKPAHPNVERVRRCHLNDIENIFPFLFIGLCYVATNPSVNFAKFLFALYTICRLVYTVLFLNESTLRPFAFLPTMIVNVYMIIAVIIHVLPICLKL